jgi:hypothetical protein
MITQTVGHRRTLRPGPTPPFVSQVLDSPDAHGGGLLP